jgi:hypothetical protein
MNIPDLKGNEGRDTTESLDVDISISNRAIATRKLA